MEKAFPDLDAFSMTWLDRARSNFSISAVLHCSIDFSPERLERREEDKKEESDEISSLLATIEANVTSFISTESFTRHKRIVNCFKRRKLKCSETYCKRLKRLRSLNEMLDEMLRKLEDIKYYGILSTVFFSTMLCYSDNLNFTPVIW